jgi:hypothetical protein
MDNRIHVYKANKNYAGKLELDIDIEALRAR